MVHDACELLCWLESMLPAGAKRLNPTIGLDYIEFKMGFIQFLFNHNMFFRFKIDFQPTLVRLLLVLCFPLHEIFMNALVRSDSSLLAKDVDLALQAFVSLFLASVTLFLGI
jgi:hypothetical protein